MRRSRLVGRADEVELFRALLARAVPQRVVFVHGPGGMGKSCLLDLLEDAAVAAGVVPLRVDARTVAPTPQGVMEAVRSVVGHRAGSNGSAGLDDVERPVLMLDTYELLTAMDAWFRDQFLANVPADALVVLAGRTGPSASWLADPAWRSLLQVIALGELPPDDVHAYLGLEDVPPSMHAELAAMSRGHPLTLSLLVDVWRRGGGVVPSSLAEAPDLVRTLLDQIVERVPSSRHRAALELCAHARFTTEALLRAVLEGDDAGELFSWLRGLSFVQEGPHGVFPHDLAREALDADLRWRDRAGYEELHRRLRTCLIERVRQARNDAESQQAAREVMFVGRHQSGLRAYYEQAGTGREYADVLGPEDEGVVTEITRRFLGEEQAALARLWMHRQPHAFRVFREGTGTIRGFACMIALHEATATDVHRDPGTRAMFAATGLCDVPLRPDDPVWAWRFCLDHDHGHAPSPSLALAAAWQFQLLLGRDRAGWELIGTYESPDGVAGGGSWDHTALMAHIGFSRIPEAGYEVAGRRFVVYGHDWRRTGVEEWLSTVTERELGSTVAIDSAAEPDHYLAYEEFRDAVRSALQDLHDSPRLQRSPLLRSRLVRERSAGRPSTEILRELLDEAAEELRRRPRGQIEYQVLERTFLRPQSTQHRSAAMLNLSFSTYRRYRDRAVEHIVEWLWWREDDA